MSVAEREGGGRGAGTVRMRDVFDTRPSLAREGGREVAMDDHGVPRR